MSVKNRKGGFFRLYDSLRIPLAAPPKEHTLPVGRVIGARLLRRSPCPRGVASETRGCGGLVPRKAFSFSNFGHNQAKQRTLRANAANSREARGGGIGDKREGGVSPQRRRVANATQIFQIKKHLFNEATVPFKKGRANEIVGGIDTALNECRRPYIDRIRIDGSDLRRSR